MFLLSGTAVAPDALHLDPMEIGFRLLCALILGFIVGVEREYPCQDKPVPVNTTREKRQHRFSFERQRKKKPHKSIALM